MRFKCMNKMTVQGIVHAPSLIFLTLFICIIPIHARTWDVGNTKPVIMNAELNVTGYDSEHLPIFDDLTNNIHNIHAGQDEYDEYLNEHKEQLDYAAMFVRNIWDDPIDFGVKLHPKTITSFKLNQGPVYALEGKTSGLINSTSKRFKAFNEIYNKYQIQVIELTNNWERSTITDFYGTEGLQEETIDYSFTDENGQVHDGNVLKGNGVYDLWYYRYLQLNNTEQDKLAEFQAKIQTRDPFSNLRDAGVKLCNANVPKVYCSRGFPFLGQINSKHRHFKAYHVAYLLETGGVWDEEDDKEEEEQQQHQPQYQSHQQHEENKKGQEHYPLKNLRKVLNSR